MGFITIKCHHHLGEYVWFTFSSRIMAKFIGEAGFFKINNMELVGGFKYFFIFIPIWGNDPI